MRRACPACGYDPGFAAVVCPRCGKGAAVAASSAAITVLDRPAAALGTVLESDPEARAVLLVTAGPDRGHSVPLGDFLAIGRDGRDGLQFSDRHVSRDHARVRLVDGQYVYQDLQGPNGSYLIVGGERVRLRGPHTLHDDDQIAIGQSIVRFIQIHGEDRR